MSGNRDELVNPDAIPDGETPATVREDAAAGTPADPSDIALSSDPTTGEIQSGLTDAARRDRAAEQSERFGAGDLRVTDDGVQVRESARIREVAEQSDLLDPEDLTIEGGEVTEDTPGASEIVNVTNQQDRIRVTRDLEGGSLEGTVRIGGERVGEIGVFPTDDDPASTDAVGIDPDKFRDQVGERLPVTVDGRQIDTVAIAGPLGPGQLPGGRAKLVDDERPGDVGTTVSGAGAADALRAGADPEDLQGAPVSESEGQAIAEAVEQRQQQQELQTTTFESGPEFRTFEPGARTDSGSGGAPAPLDTPTVDQTDIEREAVDSGETRAAVNRFGQRQLEATSSSEQFGDIVIENPATGNALEDDLRASGETVRRGIETGVELLSQGTIPATSAPGRLVRNARVVEQAGFRAAEGGGFVDGTPEEGPLETAAEAGVGGAADAINPPSAGAEAIEIGEFIVTQPGRIAADASTAAADRQDDSPLPGLVGDARDTGERAATTGFAQDVDRRAGRVADTARESFAERPIESTAGAAGGLAGGFAVGAGLGRAATRVPGVSGSDLSGRALQGVGRAARDIRDFGADSRAQGQVPSGRRGRGGDGGGGDGLPDDIAGTEPVPDSGRQVLADPSDPPRGDDVGPASRVRQQRERARQDDGETVTGELGDERPTAEAVLDPRDIAARERRRQAQRQDATEQDAAQQTTAAQNEVLPRTDEVDLAGTGAGVVAGGLLGERADVERATQSLTALGGDGRQRIDVFGREDVAVDVGGRADIDSRGDQRVDGRGDGRVDSRVDTRLDSRVDSRQDSRQDTRADTRADTRVDTRQDTRADTRADTRFDTRTDPDSRADTDEDDELGLDAAFGTDTAQFTNPVADADDFLGGGR